MATALHREQRVTPRMSPSERNNPLAVLAATSAPAGLEGRLPSEAQWNADVDLLNGACADLIEHGGDLVDFARDWLRVSDANGFHLCVESKAANVRLLSGFCLDDLANVRQRRWNALGFYIIAIDGLRSELVQLLQAAGRGGALS